MTSNQISEITQTIASHLSGAKKPLALHEPNLVGNEKKYLEECIDTSWVSYLGPFVDRFEKDLGTITKSKYALSVINGTAALELALRVLDVKPEDEVLLPALSFVGTANAVSHLGATSHFVDSEAETFGVDPEKLKNYLESISEKTSDGLKNKKSGKRISALIVTHIFGHACQVEEIGKVCKDFGLPWIEDAAEAMGSTYKDQHLGTFSDVGVVSFNGNKVITCGGGGALLMQNQDLFQHAKHLSTTAKVSHPYLFQHDEIGYNFRLPNINAAIGVAQLEKMPEFLQEKRNLAQSYEKLFSSIPGLKFFKEPKDCKSNYWLNAFILESSDAQVRNKLIESLHEKKILARPIWDLLSDLPMYQNCPKGDLSQAQEIQKSVINLPSSVRIFSEINK